MVIPAATCPTRPKTKRRCDAISSVCAWITIMILLAQCTASTDSRVSRQGSQTLPETLGETSMATNQSFATSEMTSADRPETRYFSSEDATSGRNTSIVGIQIIRSDLSGDCAELPTLTAQEIQILITNWGGIEHARYFEPLCFNDRECTGCKKFISSFLPDASCRPAYDSTRAPATLCFVN